MQAVLSDTPSARVTHAVVPASGADVSSFAIFPHASTHSLISREPALPPVGQSAPWSFVADLGLPRSGTTSFALACAFVGLRTRHGGWCTKHDDDTWYKSCSHNLRAWPVPAKQPNVHKAIEINIEHDLAKYDSLSDLPFFLVSRESYRAHVAPTGGTVSFACTLRPKADWVRSVLAHGSAGGVQIQHMMFSVLNESTPFPYRRFGSHPREPYQHAELHHLPIPESRLLGS